MSNGFAISNNFIGTKDNYFGALANAIPDITKKDKSTLDAILNLMVKVWDSNGDLSQNNDESLLDTAGKFYWWKISDVTYDYTANNINTNLDCFTVQYEDSWEMVKSDPNVVNRKIFTKHVGIIVPANTTFSSLNTGNVSESKNRRFKIVRKGDPVFQSDNRTLKSFTYTKYVRNSYRDIYDTISGTHKNGWNGVFLTDEGKIIITKDEYIGTGDSTRPAHKLYGTMYPGDGTLDSTIRLSNIKQPFLVSKNGLFLLYHRQSGAGSPKFELYLNPFNTENLFPDLATRTASPEIFPSESAMQTLYTQYCKFVRNSSELSGWADPRCACHEADEVMKTRFGVNYANDSAASSMYGNLLPIVPCFTQMCSEKASTEVNYTGNIYVKRKCADKDIQICATSLNQSGGTIGNVSASCNLNGSSGGSGITATPAPTTLAPGATTKPGTTTSATTKPPSLFEKYKLYIIGGAILLVVIILLSRRN